MSDDFTPPFTKDELLHGVALIKAHLTDDRAGIAALHGTEGDADATRATARAMYAVAHALVYGLLIPRMWVVEKGVHFKVHSEVPELAVAVMLVSRIEERVDCAHLHPIVTALSAGDVMALIQDCLRIPYPEVPDFLDQVRENALGARI